MKHLINLIFFQLVLLLSATATAHDFEVDGIYYNINGNEATITYQGDDCWNANSYCGYVNIPEAVTYNGTTYSVTSIGHYAFYDCRGLTDITIPNSVTSIGHSAFERCWGLTNITIPNSVTSIGDAAFRECVGFVWITIPNSVTDIGEAAFSECAGIEWINIPESVTIIKNSTFSNCYHLSQITIPNTVTTISDFAFYCCVMLPNITFPNSVTSIGREAFAFCDRLNNINIPKSVTSIGKDAFLACSRLTSIAVASGNPYYDSRNNCNALIETATKTLILGCQNTTIPNSVTTISNKAFYRCEQLRSIDIPKSVTTIDEYAFSFCNKLTDVYCHISNPSLVTTGSSVFYLESSNYSNRTLHVPAGSIENYQADSNWYPYFCDIVEMEPEEPASSIQLNVTTAGLNAGASLQLTATVLPEGATDESVMWASSNPNIATVDNNGLVTMHGEGIATITAMTTDGSNLSASCTVTILPVSVKGDMNSDGNINITDVTTLINHLLTGTWP